MGDTMCPLQTGVIQTILSVLPSCPLDSCHLAAAGTVFTAGLLSALRIVSRGALLTTALTPDAEEVRAARCDADVSCGRQSLQAPPLGCEFCGATISTSGDWLAEPDMCTIDKMHEAARPARA